MPLVVSGRVTGAGGSRPPMAAMVVDVVEVVAAVGAGARGVTVAGDIRRGVSGPVGAGDVTLGVVVELWGAVDGGAEGGGAGAVVAGVVGGGVVVGAVVAVERGRSGNAAAVDPGPAAMKATDTRKAKEEAARTAFTMIRGRRLMPNSVAGAGAAVLDRSGALVTRTARAAG